MASTNESNNQSSPTSAEPEFLSKLRQAAKYKVRSSETHDTVHAPLLVNNDNEIDLVLLGDSMFERFLTTGHATQFGSDNARFPMIFNAGVGGDRIVNVAYRLLEKGLLFDLQRQKTVHNIMIEMGTNDIAGDKTPVKDVDVEVCILIIEALRWACPGVRICVCALNPRTRVKKEGVDLVSNEKLKAMVDKLKAQGLNDVEYMPANPVIINHLEDDGLHLNERGYEIFADALGRQYQSMKGNDSVEDTEWSHVGEQLSNTPDFDGWKS